MLVASGVAALTMGVGRQDHVLRVVGSVGLGLIALTVPGVVLTALWIAWRSRDGAAPLTLEAGREGLTGFGLTRPWFPPLLDLSWAWEEPAARVRLVRRGRRCEERVLPLRRGEGTRIVRQVEVSDVFGLARVRFGVTESRPWRFDPSKGALDNVYVMRGMAGGDAVHHPHGSATGDLYDMRHYGAGDPIRFVLWKVFARSRELMVRTPERAMSPVQQTIAYLVSGDGDQAAAGAARAAIESGVVGEDWALGTDGGSGVATRPGDALDLIVRSAGAAAEEGAAGLRDFLQERHRGGVRRAMIFVPPRPGPWVDRVRALCQSARGVRIDVLVCMDGATPDGQTPWWADDAPDDRAPAQVTRSELRELVRLIGAPTGELLLVDRSAGTVHLARHLEGGG